MANMGVRVCSTNGDDAACGCAKLFCTTNQRNAGSVTQPRRHQRNRHVFASYPSLWSLLLETRPLRQKSCFWSPSSHSMHVSGNLQTQEVSVAFFPFLLFIIPIRCNSLTRHLTSCTQTHGLLDPGHAHRAIFHLAAKRERYGVCIVSMWPRTSLSHVLVQISSRGVEGVPVPESCKRLELSLSLLPSSLWRF